MRRTVALALCVLIGLGIAATATAAPADLTAAGAVLSKTASYTVTLNCTDWDAKFAEYFPGQSPAQYHVFVADVDGTAPHDRDGVVVYLRPDYCAALDALVSAEVRVAAEAVYWLVGTGISLQSLTGPDWNFPWDACRAVNAMSLYLPELGVSQTATGIVGVKKKRKLVRVVRNKKGKIVRRIYKVVKINVYGQVPNPQFEAILAEARSYAGC